MSHHTPARTHSACLAQGEMGWEGGGVGLSLRRHQGAAAGETGSWPKGLVLAKQCGGGGGESVV